MANKPKIKIIVLYLEHSITYVTPGETNDVYHVKRVKNSTAPRTGTQLTKEQVDLFCGDPLYDVIIDEAQ